MSSPLQRPTNDPTTLLSRYAGHLSDRKLRLFLVGCCRRHESLLTDPVVRHALEIAERYADNRATEHDRRQAERLMAQMLDWGAMKLGGYQKYLVVQAVYTCALSIDELRQPRLGGLNTHRLNADDGLIALARAVSLRVAAQHGGGIARRELAESDEHQHQATLLRCVLGHPDVVPILNPSWVTSTVLHLAHRMDDARDWSIMPILADALEDAGCTDGVLLDHCRNQAIHCRGCWVIDEILAFDCRSTHQLLASQEPPHN